MSHQDYVRSEYQSQINLLYIQRQMGMMSEEDYLNRYKNLRDQQDFEMEKD